MGKPQVTTQVLFKAVLGPEPSQVLTPGAALQGTEPAAGHGAEISVTGQGGRQGSSSSDSRASGESLQEGRAGPRAALEGFCAGWGGIAGTQIALAGRQTSVGKWGREHELRPRGPGGRASRAPQPGLSVSKHSSPLFLPLSSPRQTRSHARSTMSVPTASMTLGGGNLSQCHLKGSVRGGRVRSAYAVSLAPTQCPTHPKILAGVGVGEGGILAAA